MHTLHISSRVGALTLGESAGALAFTMACIYFILFYFILFYFLCISWLQRRRPLGVTRALTSQRRSGKAAVCCQCGKHWRVAEHPYLRYVQGEWDSLKGYVGELPKLRREFHTTFRVSFRKFFEAGLNNPPPHRCALPHALVEKADTCTPGYPLRLLEGTAEHPPLSTSSPIVQISRSVHRL